MKEAVVLAGGLGTRLQTVVKDVPKPMAPVNGHPFLEYLLKYLQKSGIERVVLSVGHKSGSISSYFGDAFENIRLEYATEPEPLGTGGGLKLALSRCSEKDVLVLNGDTFLELDIKTFFQFHQASGASVSICLRRVENAARYGTVQMNDENRITGFNEKSGVETPGEINGGVYILKKDIFTGHHLPEKFSLEKDFFEPNTGTIKMMGFVSSGYFIDIGIPEDYQRAQDDFKRLQF